MADRRLLLVVVPDNEAADKFIEIISREYEVIVTHDPAHGFELLSENRLSIAAALVDFDVARANGFSVIRYISSNTLFASVPAILITQNQPSEKDIECLSLGFSDLIYPPCPPRLLINRIENAIKAKDSLSLTELERKLKELPSIIYLKDRDGRYIFVSQRWYQLHDSDEPGWTVRGKTELEIRKVRENALVAMESDRRVLETGEGVSYVVEEKDENGREFFQVIKRATHDADGNIDGIIALINNVTDQETVRIELEKRSMTDQLTGLLNKKATEDMVRKYLNKHPDSLCALFVIDIDCFKDVNDTFGHAAGDRVLAALGKRISNSFRSSDIKGRIGGDEFMVLVKDIHTVENAGDIADKFCLSINSDLEESSVFAAITVSVGVSGFPSCGRSFAELYKAADDALYWVKNHGKAGWKAAE